LDKEVLQWYTEGEILEAWSHEPCEVRSFSEGEKKICVAARNLKKIIEQYLKDKWLRTDRDFRDRSQQGSGSRGY